MYRDDDGITVRDGRLRLDTSFRVFRILVDSGHGWEHIAEPQRDPYAACMLLAAAIWKQEPGTCLDELRAHVDKAIRELRKGAWKVTIGDDKHCVSRADLFLDIPLGGPLHTP